MTANLLSPLDYTDQADEINRVVGVDPRQKVTCGDIDKGRIESRGLQ